MVTLSSTSDIVIMLVVAALVGLFAGIGGGLIELRREPKSGKSAWATVGACVLLGAIAAVAILYFFPPEETIKETTAGGAETTVQQYNLTKLVALALIVGSAGSSFLSAMQNRALALTNAQKAEAMTATGVQAVNVVGGQLSAVTQTSVEATATKPIQKALEKASPKPQKISAELVSDVVKAVAAGAQASASKSIDTAVGEAQNTILAVATGTEMDPDQTPPLHTKTG
jgi:hypothetical protein